MKLAFGCDPNAAELKKALIAKAESLGHEVTDFGSDDPIYANVAADVAHAVAEGKYDLQGRSPAWGSSSRRATRRCCPGVWPTAFGSCSSRR